MRWSRTRPRGLTARWALRRGLGGREEESSHKQSSHWFGNFDFGGNVIRKIRPPPKSASERLGEVQNGCATTTTPVTIMMRVKVSRPACASACVAAKPRGCRGVAPRRAGVMTRAGTVIPVPGLEGVEIPIPIDADSVQGALDYAKSLDVDQYTSQAEAAASQAADVGGAALVQLNDAVLQPLWAKAAPGLEAYFRKAWGDYYYDYFIDEWNSGVNDLGRLWRFTKNDVVAGDWKRGVALAGGVYFSPNLLGLVAGLGRGYRGELAPVDALKLISGQGATLVDVRLDSEKSSAGVPDLAKGGCVDVGYAGEWLSASVRRQLSNSRALEARATATVVADLKKVGGRRGAKIVLLDSGDGRATAIAKSLTKDLGFRNVYCVDGGFASWRRSRLPVRDASGGGEKGTFKLF